MSCCDLCGVHIPVRHFVKYWWTLICNNNTHIWWHRWDRAIENKCTELTFSLIGEYGADSVDGFEGFKYLGIPLDWLYNNRHEVLRNIRKV